VTLLLSREVLALWASYVAFISTVGAVCGIYSQLLGLLSTRSRNTQDAQFEIYISSSHQSPLAIFAYCEIERMRTSEGLHGSVELGKAHSQ
jgi:hypothetical protein